MAGENEARKLEFVVEKLGDKRWCDGLDHIDVSPDEVRFVYHVIEVSKTKEIPSDYYGPMGVPITFVGKHGPEDDFEIISDTAMRPAINGKLTYKRIPITRKFREGGEFVLEKNRDCAYYCAYVVKM